MTVERAVRGFAGLVVLAGSLLAFLHSPTWVYFNVLVGVMLLQSGLTDTCPMIWFFGKLGLPRCGKR